jgi:hypothetical protein
MKKMMTGGCGLSRKLLTVMLLGVITTSYGADNSIYIDQSGENATITMLQDGTGNRIRAIQSVGNTGNTIPSKLKGDAVSIDVQQVGSGNILNLGVDTTTANGASPTSVYYKVTGSNAVGTIDINNGGSSTAASQTLSIDQTGDGAISTVSMLGSDNSLTAIMAGGNNNKLIATIDASNVTATINQTGGGGNETTLNLTGEKGTVDITSVGSTNITSITQSGGGVAGHYAKVDLTGSGNTTTINQSGTVDSLTNIKSVGNGNTFSITQRN